MADEQKSDQKSKKIKISLTSVALLVAILPILLTPPLMDVRFWFTEYVSAMEYSASNIFEVWQQYLLPGRFVPISDLYVLLYVFSGHKFLQITQAPVNYFDFLTKLTLLALLFFAIRSLYRELTKGFNRNQNSILWDLYPVALFVVWGLGLNIFWKFNGAVAYPILIYTAFIVAFVFAIATMRHTRTLVSSGQTFTLTTALLLALCSIWANFYYEISYTAIAAIVVAIIVVPVDGLSKIFRLKLSAMFLGAFAVVWLPMRWFLKNQCEANLELCYGGSQLNIGGMFGTLVQNIINPLPFADYDSINDIQQGRLPFAFSGFVIVVAIFIAFIVISHLRSLKIVDETVGQKSETMNSFLFAQWRFTLILLAMGLSGAVILSVSIRAQDLVDWGLSYRHTPILWMGYAALLLLGITWLASRTSPKVGGIALVVLIIVLTTGQWGRSWSAVRDYNADFEPVSRLYHELYNADLDDSGMANERRCLIIDELSSNEINTVRYIDPAEKFMTKFHQIDFCKR
jgi:hypothetical protein